MRKWLLPLAVIGFCLHGMLPAQAEKAPPLMPTRDAAVTYRVTGGNGVEKNSPEIRMHFRAEDGLMRVDTPGHDSYAIIDRRDDRMTVVLNARHIYMDVPAGTLGDRAFMLSSSMKFRKLGTDSIAGLPCTRWQVTARDGSGTACVTDDGVVLMATGADTGDKHSGGLVAVAVDYAPQPESLFHPPPQFRRLDLSHISKLLPAPPATGAGHGAAANPPSAAAR